MRICFLADAGSIHTQRWVKYFAARGHEIHLISLRPFGGNSIADVNLHVLNRFSPRIRIISFLVTYLADIAQVRKLIKQIQPDILHAHYISELAYAAAASGFHPLVLSAWGSDILIAPKQSRLRRNRTKRALNRADCVISLSCALKEEMIRLGATPDKIEVIPRGIDTQQFKPGLRSETLLREIGVVGSPIVISTRSLKPLYDVETLIRAVPLILDRIPEAKFIIAGEGEQRSYLEHLAQSLEVSESIRFVGWVAHHELPKYLASADVYVSTSLSDGLGAGTLEARACGTPAVVGDLPAIREWVADGEDGFIVPLRDNQALAERITRLLEDERLRKILGHAGRRRVIENAENGKQMARAERLYVEMTH